MKKCAQCKNSYELINFPKDGKRHRSYCFDCNRVRTNKFTLKRKEKRKIENKINQEKINAYSRSYYNQNKEIYKRNHKKYLLIPKNKIIHNTRIRINKALKFNYKFSSSIELLGCSIEDYKLYLESLFLPEMNWSNYGKVWEIDHIIPCSSFDLMKEEEQKKCFHYLNTQPLFKTTAIAESFGYFNIIGNYNKKKS